jgi:hypothetical protein
LGVLPASLDRASRAPSQVCDRGLVYPEIPPHLEYLPFVIGEFGDGFVEAIPSLAGGGRIGIFGRGTFDVHVEFAIFPEGVGFQSGHRRIRACVMPKQVDHLAPYLECCQAQEVALRRGLSSSERRHQTDRRFLHDVGGVLPTA